MKDEHKLTLVVAAIGALSALGGALVGGLITYYSTQEQASEARSAETRTRRAEVYPRFLDAAGGRSFAEARCDQLMDACSPASLVRPRLRYAQAETEVFVYGSDAAYRAAEKITAALGRGEVSPDEFGLGREEFQTVMCRELSAEPRGGCD